MVEAPNGTASIRSRYNQISDIWPAQDGWHRRTRDNLQSIVSSVSKSLYAGKQILNIGSAGDAYGLPSTDHFHLDLAERHLRGIRLGAVGSAEKLPFAASSFDFLLCVGSVLNYCDVIRACEEFSRVLKPGGRLLLDFESSSSGEYLLTKDFGRTSALVHTTYQGQHETIWLFEPDYVKAVLRTFALSVTADHGFHSATAIAYRFLRNEAKALRFARVEKSKIVRRILRRFSCNRVFLAEKAV